jgi:AraC family transcriptional regulator
VILHAAGERHADRFGAGRTRCLDVHGGALDQSGHLAARRAATLATRIYREFRQPDGFSGAVIEALLLEVSVEAQRDRVGELTPAWLQHARTLIEGDFRGSVALGDLASELQVHPSHLARSFRRHYGRTVGELVRELRVDFARRRLLDGMPLRAVAAEAGFADQSHMTRSFRRVTGVTPAAFRRLHEKRVPGRN